MCSQRVLTLDYLTKILYSLPGTGDNLKGVLASNENEGFHYCESTRHYEAMGSDNGAVFLSDGYINLAVLNWKTEKDADVGPNGPNYNALQHSLLDRSIVSTRSSIPSHLITVSRSSW